MALIAAALVVATVAFGTGALFLELHDAAGNLRPARPGRLVLLAIVLLVPLVGAGYLMYLDFRTTDRRP